MANGEVVKFDTMRDMVLNTTEKGPIDPKKNKDFDPTRQIQSKGRFQFKWDSQTKDVITTHISRSISGKSDLQLVPHGLKVFCFILKHYVSFYTKALP